MPSVNRGLIVSVSAPALALTLLVALTAGTQPAPRGPEHNTSTAAIAPQAKKVNRGWTTLRVPNASFSKGSRHWSVVGAHLGVSRKGHHDGRAAVLRSGQGAEAVLSPSRIVVPNARAGRVYRVTVWVRASKGVPVALQLNEAGTAQRGQPAGSAYRSRKDVWHRLVVSHRAVTNGSLNLRVVSPGPSAGKRVLVDDVSLRLKGRRAGAPVTRWESGVSGDGATDGRFAAWRGRAVAISGTWNDNFDSQANQWSVQPGAAYGAWRGDLDNAVGGIYKDRGESWAAAAAGAYDARWRQTLTRLANAWAGRPGTMYIRFAHEFNGDWYGWSVKGSETADFKAAWARFRALQLQIFPSAKLVFCLNSDTASSLNLDWRKAFPGRDQVDVLGVDYYNQYPFVKRAGAYPSTMDASDAWGAPRGLEKYRQFAASVGLPMAIPEWSSNASMGDSPAFMTGLHNWLNRFGGTGPGRVAYEIQFNVGGYGNNFHLYPSTNQPQAKLRYRQLW